MLHTIITFKSLSLLSAEPHSPLVILERGRLTFSEYEQQIRVRRDFINFARKEAESEKRVRLLLLDTCIADVILIVF